MWYKQEKRQRSNEAVFIVNGRKWYYPNCDLITLDETITYEIVKSSIEEKGMRILNIQKKQKKLQITFAFVAYIFHDFIYIIIIFITVQQFIRKEKIYETNHLQIFN